MNKLFSSSVSSMLSLQTVVVWSISHSPGYFYLFASLISNISGKSILDFRNEYLNFDTEIDAVTCYNGGTFIDLSFTAVDNQPCSGTFGPNGHFSCPAQLDKPFVTIDNVPSSLHNGSVYVYYTFFCIGEIVNKKLS